MPCARRRFDARSKQGTGTLPKWRLPGLPLSERALVSAYLRRELEGMWQANARVMSDDPAIEPHNPVFLERLLFDRNARFAQRLAPLLRRGGVFAAFGALHLYGERGAPALLLRRGFRVTPLE